MDEKTIHHRLRSNLAEMRCLLEFLISLRNSDAPRYDVLKKSLNSIAAAFDPLPNKAVCAERIEDIARRYGVRKGKGFQNVYKMMHRERAKPGNEKEFSPLWHDEHGPAFRPDLPIRRRRRYRRKGGQ